jgi:hypothetical protein
MHFLEQPHELVGGNAEFACEIFDSSFDQSTLRRSLMLGSEPHDTFRQRLVSDPDHHDRGLSEPSA